MQYFFWFWFTVMRSAFSIIRNRKRETERAYQLLDEIEKQFEGNFNPATRKKIAVSYGIYLPMLCESFTKLQGRRTTAAEKKRFIYYFICSSLFDDFTDYHLISDEQLYNISFHYKNYSAKTFDEKVFCHAHQLLRNFVADKEEYDQISHALFEAQKRSQKQYKSLLTPEEIKTITFEKGGYAVLLCSYYLNHKAEEAEQACWYKIGALIQLTNDLFDIYKDLKDEITTLPNSIKNAHEFEYFFIKEVDNMKKDIYQLSFSFRRKKYFSLSMAGVYAFGLIAIHQLKKLQGTSENIHDLKNLPRKKLIIDMEKLSNLLLWFRFAFRSARLEK